MSLPCYYALGGINYKTGFASSCAQQTDRLQVLSEEHLPSKIFNNNNFKQHRLDLMNGVWPKGCDMCEFVEKNKSGVSMRQELPPMQKFYNNDTGETGFKGLKTVEMRFSHSCNMACLHCSSAFSSGWMSRLKRYKSDAEDERHQLHQLTGAMHRNSPDEDLTISISTEKALEIVEDLNTNFPNLERVDFAGGEVLYQKQFFPTLEKLTQHPNAKNMLIMFHSNFNADFDPVKLSDLLSYFGESMIMISVDAGPKIYPYFRDGNWNKLKDNIQKFRQVNNKKTEITLVCTTSVYQIMEIEDVFAGLLTLDANYINSSIVYTPFYINPSVMMLEHKEKVLQDIENCVTLVNKVHKTRVQNLSETRKLHSYKGDDKYPEWSDIKTAYEAIENIQVYVSNNTAEQKHLDALNVYIPKIDRLWKQNFNDYITNYKFCDNKVISNV